MINSHFLTLGSDLAKNALIETSSVALLSKATCFCVVSIPTASLITQFAIAIIIANSLSKIMCCYLQYRELAQQKLIPENLRSYLDKFKTITQWIPPLNFALFFGATGNLLIHEAGHIAAASLVYKNLQAQITIPGLFKGAVSWTKTGLTPFGSLLGGVNARLFVCVAGPLAAVLVGTVILVAGLHFKDRFPELSKYLMATAVFTIAYQALYAISALWASKADLGHDFVMLWHVGVHPAIASIFLASIPLIALCAYLKSRAAIPNQA